MTPRGAAFAIPFALVALACAHAQDLRPVPIRADDTVVLRVQGPDRIRRRFGPTNLGVVLGDETGLALRAKLAAAVFGDAGDARQPFSELFMRLIASDAELTLGVRVARGEHDELVVDGALRLAPDGKLDLAAIAAGVADAARGAELPLGEIEYEGKKLLALKDGGSLIATLPFLHDGALLVVVGEDLGLALERRLAPTDALPWQPPEEETNHAAVALHADLAVLVDASLRGQAREARSRRTVLEALGFDSLRSLRVLVRAAGPNLELESRLAFTQDGPRGLLAGFLPPIGEAPALASLGSDEGAGWFAGKFDLAAVIRATIEGIGHYSAVESRRFDGDVEKAIADIREQFEEFAGFDLENEFAAKLGTDFFFAGARCLAPTPDADPDETDEGFALAVTLRDAAGFARAHDKFVAGTLADFVGLGKEGDAIGDVRIFGGRDSLAGLGKRHWFLAGGDEGHAALEALIGRTTLGGGAADTPIPLPATLDRVRSRFPAGWSGCGTIDVGGAVGVLLLQVTAYGILDEGDDFERTWREFVKELREPLTRAQLDRVAITTGWADGSFTLRVDW
ncbi:MAG: hypothetical protein HZB39_05265 [Planctomycetes bacterium]|nr:hypothetical protein [Planctomycetota bacterium]